MSKRNIVHVDIPAKDRDAAVKFYQALFGWETNIVTDPGTAYIFQSGNISGAFAELGETVQPGDVVIYVGSDDIDADLKKAESLGAKVVMPKMVIGQWGAMAVFTDPTGNNMALWKDGS